MAALLAANAHAFSAIAAAQPGESQSHFLDQPLTLAAPSSSDAQVFYATNSALPSPSSGQAWDGPLRFSSTAVLRWARFKNGVQEGPVGTRTFLNLREVPAQTGAGLPPGWGFTNGHPVAAYYGMEPEILRDPGFGALLHKALRALPTLSLVLQVEDLFGEERGIYSHPLESGAPWERSASLEWIQPNGKEAFQVNCGLRIQGGWNRKPEESPKHGFRLVFHERYGVNRLDYPVFGTNSVGSFETLVLRPGCNNSWLHWSGTERRRGEYLRDQWMRDSMGAMGHVSARGVFVHLYLNGMYWGIYNLAERPSAPFQAAHFGGDPSDYDCRNGNHILEGKDSAWRKLFELANSETTDGRTFEKISQWLDVPQFIDFMLLNLYGANGDWDSSSNWYAARRRKPAGPFRFFVWDAERTLEGVDDTMFQSGDDQCPARLFQRLCLNAQFRQLFAERARKHLEGALSSEACAERYRTLARQLEVAIVAESARWGGYRSSVHPYKTGPFEIYRRDTHWRPEVRRLLEEYFPKRGEALREQLRAAGLLAVDH